MSNWIKGAIKHPGALHKELGVPEGKKIPAEKLAKAAKAGGTLGRRARLAETLSHMHQVGRDSKPEIHPDAKMRIDRATGKC